MAILTLEDLSAKLVELESHPGREHLRRYSPTGATAQRWGIVDAVLGRLWDDVADQNADLEQADAGYETVKEFFDAVAEINETVARRIAPVLRQLDAAGAAIPKAVADMLTVSASDPLSMTLDDIDRRIASVTELVEWHTHWPEAVTETAARLDVLRETLTHAAQTRERATQTVLTGPLPVSADCEPTLRADLTSMTAPDPAMLSELRRRIEIALERIRQDERLAQGLLDRRAELAGRLRAYEAKAARLGLAQDSELSSSRVIATGLLTREPCDLRAVTRAVVDYQQTLSAKQEKTR